MAEEAPRHPVTTPAEANTYAPYSVLAVIALTGAILFVLIFLPRAAMFWRSGQPYIEPPVLVIPIAVIVLAFAARRQIQNSEGTRAGLPLVNTAWWIAVVGGVGYAAYLVTFQLGVRQDAADSFRRWAKNLNEVDLNDPKNPAFFYVFDGSLEPDKQDRIKVGQANVLYQQNKPQYLIARQSFLVRLANRNRGQLDIDVGGLDNLELTDAGQKGQLGIKVKCPEGEFSCAVPMASRQVDGQWRWQVQLVPSGNQTSARVTRYGKLIAELTGAAAYFVTEGFIATAFGQTENPVLLPLFSNPPNPYPVRGWGEGQVVARVAVVSNLGFRRPEPANYDALIAKYFEPVDKGDPVREAEQRRMFVQCWRYGRIFPAGRVIQANPEQAPVLTVTPEMVEIKVPVEIQGPGMETNGSAARGAVVLRCDDKAFLAKLNELRAAAPSDPLVPMSEVNSAPMPGAYPLKLHHIESDMKPVMPEKVQAPAATP